MSTPPGRPEPRDREPKQGRASGSTPADPRPGSYVFLSYAASDDSAVQQIADALAYHDLTVRWDKNLQVGEPWASRLPEMLVGAAAVIVVWSRDAAQSRFVQTEAAAARAAGKLFPVTLDGFASVPPPYRDLQTADLSGWTGNPVDERFRRLAAALRDRVGLTLPDSRLTWQDLSDGLETSAPAVQEAVPKEAGPELRIETRDLLAWASAVQEARGAAAVEDVDVVLGGLVAARAGVARQSEQDLYRAVFDSDRLDAALAAAGAVTPIDRAATAPAGDLPALARAVAAARMTGAFPAVWSRHLLAGALTGPSLPGEVLAALGTDDTTLRRTLRAHVADEWPEERSDAWDAVLAEPETELTAPFARDLVPVWRRARPGEAAPALEDHLGVEVYVGMLATLIARRSTAMPLSIGLFGEWGSGKSYFMELLRQQVEVLSHGATARDSAYLTDIIQVRFNAWHYADTNLWASLAAEFFEQLAREDTDPVEERRLGIAAQLTHAQQEQEALQKSATAARDRAVRLRSVLADATAARDRATRTFNRHLLRAVLADERIRTDLEGLADRLGVGRTEQERVLRIADDVRGIGDDLAATRRVAAARSRRWPFVLLVIATLLLAAAAFVPAEWVGWFRGGTLATLAGLVGGIGVAAGRARALMRDLRGLADRAEMVEAAVREGDGELAGLATQVRLAETHEAAARAEAEEALSRVAELRRQLEQLQPGRRLYDFLAERAASTEYRSQLGIISLVRRDFEQLVAGSCGHRVPPPASSTCTGLFARPGT